jgi:DNA-binding beta-propeller fold protein YncE
MRSPLHSTGDLWRGIPITRAFKIYSFGEQSQAVQIIGAEGTAAGEFGHGLAATLGSFKIFHQVQGIAVDSNGLIYVVDQGNQRIQVFDGAGKVQPEKNIPFRFCTKEAPRCADGLWRRVIRLNTNGIQGIAIDADGGVYISDKGMSRIYRLLPGGKRDPNFNLQEVDAANGEPMLKEPESLVLHQNKLFVSNEGSGEIKMFDRRTGRAIGPGAGFGAQVFSGKAEGLAVTGDYLFAVDVQNTRIAVFELTGESPKYLLGFVGDFQSADGIAIDPTGKYVAIADQGNFRVLLYALPEILHHLAALKR